MAITWSTRQEEIFNLALFGMSHIIVESRAGTAKTTTAVEILRRMVEDRRFDGSRALVGAFNNRIRDELVERVKALYEEASDESRRASPIRIEVAGVHQLGFGLVRGAFRGITVDKDKGNRCASLAVANAGILTINKRPDRQWVLRVNKLAQLSKYELTETTDHIAQLAESFSLADDVFHLGTLVDLTVNAMTLAINDTTTCDFPDQIWFPARFGLAPRVPYPFVYGDEVQDWSPAELWVIRRMLSPEGRLTFFGDPKQAVYAFKGADAYAMDRMYRELSATPRGCTLAKLTTTYRCPKAIVKEAQKVVPDFEAAPSAPEGVVSYCTIDQLAKRARPGDVVISRSRNPLGPACLKLIRAGTPAFVVGRDYGDTVLSIIDRSGCSSISTLTVWAKNKRMTEVKRLLDDENEEKAEEVGDLYDTLIGLAEEVESITRLKEIITDLFRETSSNNAVACSTVHKAKGLEWQRVFLLIDTFNTKNEENRNILYVGITRAKYELVYVTFANNDQTKTDKKAVQSKKPAIVLPRLGGPRPTKDGAFVPYYDLDD